MSAKYNWVTDVPDLFLKTNRSLLPSNNIDIGHYSFRDKTVTTSFGNLVTS